ncbi:MAG: TrmH family RNA methyltransferase [Patescibacteria group bacterium]|jgi:23S rRNA (guanosine2251-2'-O)-methyltransferase
MARTLNSAKLRRIDPKQAKAISQEVKRNPIYLVINDILDTYNIGGFFRLADAIAVEKVYLCGRSATPPNPRIVKASVGAYKLVPWEYKETFQEVVAELRQVPGIQIVGIEQSEHSQDYRKINYRFPLAFVLGNETKGLSQADLKLIDQVAEIPMYGVNKSLNVMIAAGVVIFRALHAPRRFKLLK